MSARSYLSIGDVLTLLRQEFPDVTISKIRFLESQGLVDPERTPSGYRKFYEQDVERLRWVLRQQREHFLPLRVIKDRLDAPPNAREDIRADPAGNGSASKRAATAAPPGEAVAPAGEAVANLAVPSGAPATARPEARADPSAARARPVASPEAPPPTVAHPAPASSPLVLRDGERPGNGPVSGPGASRVPMTSIARTVGSRMRPEPPPASPEPRPEPAAAPAAAQGSDPVPESDPSSPAASGTAPVPTLPLPDGVPAGGSPAGGSPAGVSRSGGTRSPEHSERPERTGTAPARAPAPMPVVAAGATFPGPTPPGRPGADHQGAVAAARTRLTMEELARDSGLTEAQIAELGAFGLLKASTIGGEAYFDADSLEVARVAARFAGYGIEARHLRLYKNAADREAGFVEQIILPLFRQRNPEARTRGQRTAEDLISLGARLHGALIRAGLDDVLGH